MEKGYLRSKDNLKELVFVWSKDFMEQGCLWSKDVYGSRMT